MNMKDIQNKGIGTCALYVGACMLLTLSSCAKDDSTKASCEDASPMMILRLSSADTDTMEHLEKTYQVICENPGCCDEVWISTGVGVRTLDWHREHAERTNIIFSKLKNEGVVGSLQLQMTIGHGDSFGEKNPDAFVAKEWGGWVGSTGAECKYCNCPSQPAFIQYMKEMARLYASTKPSKIWIDDDLRFENHAPATIGSRIGCWCPTCIELFNAQCGTQWTRESLDMAMRTDTALESEWRKFSIGTLANLAKEIAEVVHAESPETRLGLQQTFFVHLVDEASAILKVLSEATGTPASYRAGGGAYYDENHPCDQIVKSMEAANYRKAMGNPDYVDNWVPEVESWPRVYGGRTAQSVLAEGFTAIAYGMDGVSYFTVNITQEDPAAYSRYMLNPISQGYPVLKKYVEANRGTLSLGYELQGDFLNQFRYARLGLPVLVGLGKSLGTLEDSEMQVNAQTQPSREVQEMREKIHQAKPSPVVCCAPYSGMVMPRITPDGKLKTIGLLSTRIDRQWDIRLRLQNVPDGVEEVVWHEMKKKPVTLKLQKEDGQIYVTVPELDAWNGGFIEF